MKFTNHGRARLLGLIEIAILLVVLAGGWSLWHWYTHEEGGAEVYYTVVGVGLAGLVVVRRWLQGQTEGVEPAWVAGEGGAHGAGGAALRRQMAQLFDLEKVRTLCFDLGVPYDTLTGATLDPKIESLITHCQKHNRLPDLMAALQATRPDVQWAQPTLATGASHLWTARNRENLLNHIQTTWIDGFLKQSIHSEILKLSLSYRPEAVGQRPWQLVLKQKGQRDQPVPAGYSLPDLFAEAGRNLLILGEPGSGKTITMLQLGEALLAAARANPQDPMPLIVNLSSWAREKLPLGDWLMEEGFSQYGVARELTRAGIAQNQFIYLLDGLDEVAEEARGACVAAMNQFKQTHPAEMVVCSRVVEYEALPSQLHLGTAIQVLPLNEAQIEAYVSQEGLELQAVRATLKQDPALRELAATPLMLSMMTLAYRGLSREALQPLADPEARRRHLFEHYVEQMFTRRPIPAEAGYSQTQATSWLANLAQGMVLHDLSIFYMDWLQPTWLRKGNWYFDLFFEIGAWLVWLLDLLILGYFFAKLSGWVVNSQISLNDTSDISLEIIILGICLVIAFLAILYVISRLISILISKRFGFALGGLVCSLSGSISFGLLAISTSFNELDMPALYFSLPEPINTLAWIFISGIFSYFAFMMLGAVPPRSGQINYTHKWLWPDAKNISLNIFLFICIGVAIGFLLSSLADIPLEKAQPFLSSITIFSVGLFAIIILLSLIYAFNRNKHSISWILRIINYTIFPSAIGGYSLILFLLIIELKRLLGGTYGMILFVTIITLIIGIMYLINKSITFYETPNALVPNQNIQYMKQNGLRFVVVSGLLGLSLNFIWYMVIGENNLAITVWIVILVLAVYLTFDFQIMAQHYVLRCLLAKQEVLPYPLRDKRLVSFLDGMHERILLRRVGGGWIFVHRSLMEYLASLAPAREDIQG